MLVVIVILSPNQTLYLGRVLYFRKGQTMKFLYALLVAAALVCCANAYVDESLISFGIGVSEDSWNGLLNAAILPIISDTIIAAGEQLPPNCCYKNVEVARTGLYLENFSLPADSVKTTGSIHTTPKGPFVTIDVQFDLDFYYKLCIDTVEDRCTTLFFCKGDSRLHFDAKTTFLIDVRADSNGEPIILINDFDFHLAIPVKSGLCEFLSAGIDVILPLINVAANIKLPTILDSVLASFTSNLNQTIVVSGQPFDLQWQLTNQSQSSAVGTSLMFVLNVLEVASGDKPGPFVPKPIPNALSLLTYNKYEVLFEVSSAVFNNIIYSYYSLKEWKKVIDADGFKITVTFLECPDITFQNIQSGADGAALHLNLKMAVKKFGVPFTTAKANVTVYFELEVASDGMFFSLRLLESTLSQSVLSSVNLLICIFLSRCCFPISSHSLTPSLQIRYLVSPTL